MRPPARYIDRCAPPRTATARVRFGGGAGQCPGRFLRRTTVGRAPAQANRNGPGPYGLGTCVRQGPAARSSAVQNLGPLSIKFRLLAASLFIKPSGPSVKLQSSREVISKIHVAHGRQEKSNRGRRYAAEENSDRIA